MKRYETKSDPNKKILILTAVFLSCFILVALAFLFRRQDPPLNTLDNTVQTPQEQDTPKLPIEEDPVIPQEPTPQQPIEPQTPEEPELPTNPTEEEPSEPPTITEPDPIPAPIEEEEPDPEPEPEPETEPPVVNEEEWNLVLANPNHPLPETYEIETANVQSKYLMDVRCADAMKQMIADAKEDGVRLLVCSAYRPISRQRELYDEKVAEYIRKGYDEDEAAEIAGTIVAYPGTSEHQTGLAADIVTPSYQNLNAGFEKTEAFQWLYAHCADYGFILRYPKDKQDITEIIYEPWHYRYVGVEHAQAIMSQGICLEEYLGVA